MIEIRKAVQAIQTVTEDRESDDEVEVKFNEMKIKIKRDLMVSHQQNKSKPYQS